MARHRSKGRRCYFESLENRRMLAGNVTARIDNGVLVIEGDDLDNGITITAGDNAGEVVVTGVDAGGSATNVNGTANGEVTLTGFTGGCEIEMEDGNDAVSITDLTVSGKAKLKGGEGADEFNLDGLVFHSSLKLRLGKDADTATLTNVDVTGKTKIAGRRGDDDVTIEDSTFTELKVSLGRGNDTLTITGVTVSDDTDVNGRSGTNNFTNGPGNSLADLDVRNFNEEVIPGPALTISGPESVNESALYTLALSATGTGASTITQWTINWGDGSTPQVVTSNPTSVTHTFTDGSATRTISATATNPDGTFNARDTVSVTVNDVAPTLTLSGAASVQQGVLYTLNLSSSDLGTDTITQWTINWGDGTPVQTVTGNPASVTHTFTVGSVTRTISATATNEDSTFNAGNTLNVAVTA